MKWLFVALILTGWIVRLGGGASSQEPDPVLEAKRAVVAQCVEEVRREEPDPRFEAYVTDDGTLNTFATERQSFFFLRCIDRLLPGVWETKPKEDPR